MHFLPIIQTFRGELNDILSDYGLPLFLFLIVLGIITGLASNFSKINSDQWSTRKEGLVSLLVVIGYVLLAGAVLTAAVAAARGWSVSI